MAMAGDQPVGVVPGGEVQQRQAQLLDGREVAHPQEVLLQRPVKGSALKRWGLAVAKRAGGRKAKVALARKLACVLHRMLVDGTPFAAEPARQWQPAAAN